MALKPYCGMGNWTPRKERIKKGSQTPGRMKNPLTCQATTEDKFYARRSRSYKDNGYAAWCAKYRKINGG